MLVAALLVATFATVAVVGAAADGECKLNICAQLDTKKEPLLLEITETRDKREQLDFIYPEEVEYKTVDKSKQKIPQGILRVAEGKKLLVACPGEGNVVEGSKKATGTAVCTKGKLIINGLEANNKTMSCYKDVARSWVKETNEECGKGNNVGTKFILGFRLTDDGYETFFPMIEICHNTDKMITYYSNHVVHGESMEGRVRFDGRNKFKPDGSFAGVNPETAYSQNRQKEAFDVILGKGAGEKYSVKNKKFLARGHLAPDADFIYNSGQQLTYYYINAAPQWQNFNAYNWLKIENAVRQLSEKVGVTLNVWTGTYGILKLEFKGVEKEIYLEPKELAKPKRSRKSKAQTKDPEDSETTPEDHMPVPEVFWKVVQHPIDRSCTVAVGHNNVFLESEPTPICDPVTVDGWPSQDEFPLDRGSVYYCNYNSFKQTVDYLPEIDCTDLFEFPHKKSS